MRKIELLTETEGIPEGLEEKLAEILDICCAVEGVESAACTVRLVDNSAIRRINAAYRGIDSATDVLSFPSVDYPAGRTARDCPKLLKREFDPETGAPVIGDVVISLERAQEQAEEFSHSLMRETCYLMAHSVFHLFGYDHMNADDKREMREMEERVMDKALLSRKEDMTYDELFSRAVAALGRAYAPYSGFKVGACVLDESGRAFEGCNIENASFGATICAERCAVSSAVVNGCRAFTAIAVVGEEDDAWPCGICRQVLNEFSKDMDVICGSAKTGTYSVMKLTQLLPKSFGPEQLAK